MTSTASTKRKGNGQGGFIDALRVTVRALANRNYRLFFAGQGLSNIGSWVQAATMGWLVYRLSGSKFHLGLVGFAGQILTFLVAPFAGVLAERFNRRRALMVTQALAMLQAFALAALTLSHMTQIWHIVVLSIFMGLVNGFDMPIRQTFVVDMLQRKEDLPNAIALNSLMFNGARLVGPCIAGALVAALHVLNVRDGEGVCFLINGVTFLAVIGSLAAMRIKQREIPAQHHVLHSLKEGFSYVVGFHPVRAMLMLLMIISLVGAPYGVLLPVFAKDVLRADSVVYGLLMSAAGVGAMCGALLLASRRKVPGLERLPFIAPILLGTGLVGLSLSRVAALSVASLVAVGFGLMLQMASTNTLMQTVVDDDKRGRVMSFYTMSFMGMGPFGALLAGSMASHFGAPATVFCGGVASIIAALCFMPQMRRLRQAIHPVYHRLGLLDSEAAPILAE